MTAIYYEIEYYAETRRHVQRSTAEDMAIAIAKSLDRRRGVRVHCISRCVSENGKNIRRKKVAWK